MPRGTDKAKVFPRRIAGPLVHTLTGHKLAHMTTSPKQYHTMRIEGLGVMGMPGNSTAYWIGTPVLT